MGQERRRAPRLDSNLFSNIRIPGQNELLGRGVVVDVSVSGFGLETELDLEINQSYEVDVEVPITFRAKVVRSLTPGQMKRYGIKMEGLGFFDKLLLKRLLKNKRHSIKF